MADLPALHEMEDLFTLAGTSEDRIRAMLDAAGRGEPGASEELLPLLYDELRSLAGSWMARLAPGQTLQPTALVHEAYLRLLGKPVESWDGTRHFFFAASRAMSDILVEQARRKASNRGGGEHAHVSAEHLAVAIEAPADDMLALDDALRQLEREDLTKHQIVMLRFFGGLTARLTAETLGTSLSTVEREWRYIRVRLHELMGAPVGSPDDARDT